jgi:hypothetical protein
MIFGFNTDIRHEDTVYHVQSEAREGEKLLQTQVFVRGRCVGKRAVSYASIIAEEKAGDLGAAGPDAGASNAGSAIDPNGVDPNLSDSTKVDTTRDQHKEKLLRDLHRQVLDAIREGHLDSILDKRDTPEVLAAVKQLELEWTNADSVHSHGALMMHLRVTEAGAPIPGARLTFRFERPDAAPYYAQILTDSKGQAEMSVQVDEKSLPDSSVLVQANFAGRTATRKFHLRAAP